jgi:diguanylate cyclase (GGDEF)-like protein/PAS domain S-box-containing protein
MHSILASQIRRYFGNTEPNPDKIQALLIEIDATYKEFEEEIRLLRTTDNEELSAIIEKKRTMEAFFSHTPDVIFHIKNDGTIISSYGAIENVFGLSENFFKDKNIFELNELFDNDKFQERAKVSQLSREIINFQLDRPETHYAHHFDARIIPLPHDDMLIDLHNITLKKHAEDAIKETHRRLQDIIEFLPDATFVIDSRKKVIAWNRAIEKMTGIPKKDMIRKGDNAYAIPFYGSSRPTLINFIGEPIGKIENVYPDVEKDEDTLISETFVPDLHNGRGAWVWIKVSPLYGRNHKVIGAIQSIRDVSQRVRSEQITKALYKLTNEVFHADGLDILFKSIHKILREVLKVNNFYVALKDNKCGKLSFPYFVDEIDPNPFTDGRCNENSRLLVNEVIKTGQPLILKNEDIGKRAALKGGFAGTAPQIWVAAPLKSGSNVIGAIVTQDYHDPNHFSDSDHELLIAAAENIAIAVERKNAAEALLKSELKFRNIFENSVEGLFQTDASGTLISVNPTFTRIMGYESSEEIENKLNINDFYHYKADKDKISRLLAKHGELKNFECLIKRKSGNKIWISVNIKRISGQNSREYLEGAFDDITEKKLAESSRDNQKARFSQLFENSPQAICLLDKDGNIVNVNKEFKTLFGDNDNLEALRSSFIPEDKIEEAQTFVKAVISGQFINEESQRRTSDGRIIPVSILGYPFNFKGSIAGAFFIFNDISERKEYEKQITHQALHDSLTGLPNRALFIERLSRALARKKADPSYSFAVMLVDLDRFKKINDSLGHMAGDELLVYIGHKLKGLLRPIDSLARLGGDEFGILLDSVDDPKQIISVAEKVRDSITDPLLVHGNEVVISASIGIVLKMDEYRESDSILRDADISMYRSKELGKNRFMVFTKRLHDRVISEVQVESELRKGLADNEFETFYQPIYALNSMSLNGFEALIRWNHPKNGLVSPGRFIPVAEESGLISDIGKWVFADACATLSAWRKNFPSAKNVTLAVNLSARQFSQPDLLEMTDSILRETGIPPENLRLEVTETAIMENLQMAIQKLRKIRRLGVKIAVDDFGIGYSSLSQLQALPVDVLKVDQSFVMRMEQDSESKAIVKMVIALAHTLGLDVVAEGVETEGQLNMLHAMNCNLVQGFLFSRPVPATEARKLLHTKNI